MTLLPSFCRNLKNIPAHLFFKTAAIALITLFGSTYLSAQSITKSSAGAATTTSLVGGSSNWTSFTVSHIQNADGVSASATVSGKKSTFHIRATNWGYAIGGSGGFPTGAFLSGIKVEIKRNKSQGAIVDAQNLKLILNGNPVGNSRSRNKKQWPSQAGYVTYGSSSDKWGTTLTINDIINGTFGVQVAAKGALKGNNASTAQIDHIRITVYYNLSVYYSKSTGSLSSLATWGTNSDGSGTAPTNFTNNSQIFILTNRSTATLDASLTISGANSKLLVGDPNNALAKTVFTIPSTFAYTGVIDCSSKDGTTINSSDVVITNTTLPTIGTLDAGTTVTYNAAGNQNVAQADYDNLTISGTGTKTILSSGIGMNVDGVLTINTGATLGLNGQVLNSSADPNGAASCIVNNGTISGTGKVYVTGDGQANISGTGTISSLENDNSNDLSIVAGANQTITTSLILSSGAFLNSGTFAMGTGSTIYRDQGMFSATSPGSNAYNVSYTSSFQEDGSTANPPGNELAGTNLSNVSIDLPTAESITLNTSRTLKGNFTVNTGTFNAGSNTLTIGGNFTNNSTFTPSTSTVAFNGSAAATQIIGGTSSISFSSLTVNTTGTGGVTLAKDITVTSALTLTNGKVFTGANTLIYTLASGVVTRTNGYVAGNLNKVFSTGATSRTFEVGTNNYTPIQISFASVTTAGSLTASATFGDHPSIGSSNIDGQKSVNTYWEISKPSGSLLAFTTYGITASYTTLDNDAVANASNYKLGRYAAGTWTYVVPTATPTSTQLTIPTTSFNTASGQFQVGVQGSQPIISTQPSNKTTCSAAATSFTATASGGIISSVTWQISTNGGSSYANLTLSSPYSVTTSTLPSANNAAITSTLNISSTSGLDGNLYRAVFTNAYGNANSNGASLTANSSPAISSQPVAQAICVGSASSFSVVATGGNLSYQWRKNGANISGATNADYTISSIASADAGSYDVVITNSCSSINSSAVALTVNLLPAITAEPTNQTVCAGSVTTLTVGASGAGISYQWRKENIPLVNGVNGVSGATSATLTINNTPLSAAGVYNVVVSGSCNPNTVSEDIVLTVDESASITGQPTSQTICSGTTNVQFTVTATGSGLTYQWKKDGANLVNGGNISGATSATLTLATTSASNAGDYTVLVATSTCSSGTLSTAASLAVNASVTPSVSIALTSGANPTCSGTAVTFTATPVNGGATPSYQWKKDGVNVGTNSNSYTDAGTAAGAITVVMTTNATCASTPTATSNSISLGVNPQLTPSVSIALTSGANPTCSGTSVSFTATPVNGGATPSYQWKKDGVNVGTNSSSYSDAGTVAGAITVVMTTNATCASTPTATSNSISLSINPKVTPTVSIALSAGSNPTCPANTVTFTATPVNGGTPSYQWKKDGVNVGTNSNTYTDAGLTSGTISLVMTSSLSCVTASQASSNSIVLTVNPNTWLSGTDGNWNNPANWCSGAIPTAATSVLIPAANTPYPVLSANGTTGALQLEPNATVTIGSNIFSINGALTGTGTITGSSQSSIILGGSGAQSLRFTSGSHSVKNLTLSHTSTATATLQTALKVYNAISWTTASGTLDLNNQSVTLVSNASGSASVGRIMGGLSGASNVTVERFIPQNTNRAWRVLSIPTIGQTIHESWQENMAAGVDPGTGYGTNLTSNSANWAANGFDFKTPGNSLLTYNSTTAALAGVPSTLSPIATTSGYFLYIRGDRSVTPSSSIASINSTTLRTKGSLYQGTQLPVTIPADKSALVGNIYASTIDLRNLTIGGGSVGTDISVWDPKITGTYGLGAYQVMTNVGGNYFIAPGGGSYGSNGSMNNTIQSGQAFFAKATATDGTITFTENAKTTGSTSSVFDANSFLFSKFATNLYVVKDTGLNLADGTLQIISDSYNTGIDQFDSYKRFNFGENFYISKEGADIIIEKRQAFTTTDTIQFNMKGLKKVTYLLEFVADGLDANNLSAWLEDSYTKTRTPINLNGSTAAKFSIDANAASSVMNRFRIVFLPNTVLPLSITGVKAYQANSHIAVEWKLSNEENVDHYVIEKSTNGIDFTAIGTKAATGNNSGVVSYSMLDMQAATGTNYYRIYSENKNGEKQYSAVVKVVVNAKAGLISIYPNPVTTESIKLQFSNMQKGMYTARLLGNNGAVIVTRSIYHAGSDILESMKVPAGISKGNYMLEMIYPDKTKTVLSLIIAK